MALWAVLATAFPLGLATSLHCVGMCGGTVMAVGSAYTKGEGKIDLRGGWLPSALYHLGRGITYVSIGAMVGAAGNLMNRLGSMMGVHYIALGFSMIVLLVTAAHLLGWMPVAEGEGRSRMASLLAKLLGLASKPSGAFTIGALTGFLPCGPLYAGFALAVAAGSPALGAASMLAFWLGTVPLLFALGRSSSLLVGRLRRRASVAIAVVAISVAVSLLAMKIAGAMNPAMKHNTQTCPMHHPEH